MKTIKLMKDTDVLGQEKSKGTRLGSNKKSSMTLYVFSLIALAIIILVLARA